MGRSRDLERTASALDYDRHMVRLSAVLLVASLTVLGCGSDGPPDQRAYVKVWRSLQATWKTQAGNDPLRARVEKDTRAFFGSRPVRGWHGKVVAVRESLGASWVEVEESGMTFLLRPPDGSEERFTRDRFMKLTPGDRVAFDGTILSELSSTISSALESPQLSVTLSNVERLH
jgi:hypothetical protein